MVERVCARVSSGALAAFLPCGGRGRKFESCRAHLSDSIVAATAAWHVADARERTQITRMDDPCCPRFAGRRRLRTWSAKEVRDDGCPAQALAHEGRRIGGSA